jgi:GNAT superfamily N-acetyltransferase
MNPSFHFRAASAADQQLLFTLFAAGKIAEFAPLGWSPQQLQPLLHMQFRAQQMSWAQNSPAAADTILCLEDDTPVGRHLIERQPSCYRSIDLAVLPDYQNRGIGTWALQQIQNIAALESVAVRLRVIRTNPALHLYERLGFIPVSGDAIALEMEWQPHSTRVSAQPQIRYRIVLENGSEIGREEVLERIFAFVRAIGLSIHLVPVPSNSFLPGIQMVSGGLRVDLDTLLYPGDLLHEAGHLAVMTPAHRLTEFPSSTDPAEEMAAIAWSYAAALHIGVPAEIVFHPDGYRGQAKALQQRFENGDGIGLPVLWWVGLTTQPLAGQPSIYPKMLRWLREAPVEETPTTSGDRSHSLQAV